jgi:hypothetical protein
VIGLPSSRESPRSWLSMSPTFRDFACPEARHSRCYSAMRAALLPVLRHFRCLPGSDGVRNERYTYLRYPRQKGEIEALFDRVGDPNALKNIIHTAPPELAEQLRRRTDELVAKNA